MNNHNNIVKLNRNAIIIALSLILLISAWYGCMNTTEPEDNKQRNLQVKVVLIDPTDASNKIPLGNVDVQVFNVQNTAAQPLQAFTNAQGVALFQMQTPLNGRNLNILANYNNNVQSKTNILICGDTLVLFVFDTTTVDAVNCQNLIGSDSLIFIDENGSRNLRQNTPANINQYERCWSITNSSTTETVNVTIPAVNSPFKITSIIVGSNTFPSNTTSIDIPPGQTMTVCFAVSTAQAGTFTQDLNFTLRCGTNQGARVLNMRADILPPACLCEDLPDNIEITLPERTPVGQYVEYTQNVLTNSLNCDITISQASFDNAGNSWQILSPQFPVTLKPGESLNLRVRFTPNRAGELIGILRLTIRTGNGNNDCTFDVRLNSNGCNNTCPLYSEDGVFYRQFGVRVVDTLSYRPDNRVMVSISAQNRNTVSKTYFFMNPDTACNAVTINITTLPADNYARQYYQVSPQSLTLAPGDFGMITVTFSAPDIAEFEQIAQTRPGVNPPGLSDSLFKITIQVRSGNCVQEIEDNTVVSTFPDISPIINLRVYSQRTPLKPEPENEVYYFGDNSRTIIKGPGGSPGPYPPTLGDIYMDFANTNDTLASKNPPTEPILVVRNNFPQVKRWRTGYAEANFSNVPQLYNDFSNAADHTGGYGDSPITNIQVGDVIAFDFGNNVYALIYIRRVDNGTENTSSRQSGIEYRAVYPVYVP